MAFSNGRNFKILYDFNETIYDQIVTDCQTYISHPDFPSGWWLRAFKKYLLLSFACDIDQSKINIILERHPILTPYEWIDLSRLSTDELNTSKKWMIDRFGNGKQKWRLENYMLAILDLDEAELTEFKLTWL